MSEKKSEPSVCFPWDEKKKEYDVIKGDEEILKKWWEEIDSLAAMFLWFMIGAM